MPTNTRLVEYIRKQLEANYNLDQIKIALLKQGWSEADINNAIEEAVALLPKKPSKAMKRLGILKKIKKVLLSPTEFFENVKYEQGIGDTTKYLLVFVIILIALFLPIIVATFTAPPADFPSLLILLSVLLIPLSIISELFLSVIYHIGLLIIGAKGGYSNTFKAFVYSLTPTFIISFILLLLLSFVLLVIPPILPEAIIFFTILLAVRSLLLLSGIWGASLLVKGITILHGISTIKAIIDLIISTVILCAIIFFISMLVEFPFLPSIPIGSMSA